MNTTTTTTGLDPSVARSLVSDLAAGASVYVALQPAEPLADAEEDLELRWRRLAARLVAQGADDATITAIWSHLARLPASPATYAVFATGGSVRFGQALPGPARADVARFGAPMDVVPLLAWSQRHPAHVVVLADRTGADVTAVPRGAVSGSSRTVVGPDDEIERNAPGGWAQARYQRRAEDSWQHNAAAVAREVAQALRRVDARLLLVAGDVRAVQLLRDHLPASIRHGVDLRTLPGGRSPDGSGAVRHSAATDAIGQHAAAQTTALLDRLEAERRHGGTAVEGVPATLAALAEGRVRTLFVADDAEDGRAAWFGPDTLCAEAPSQVTATTWVAQGRLVDVAVRAALLTDAEVHVLSPQQSRAVGERIGALCRFTPAPGPEES